MLRLQGDKGAGVFHKWPGCTGHPAVQIETRPATSVQHAPYLSLDFLWATAANAVFSVPLEVVLAAEHLVTIWARELQFTIFHGHASLLSGTADVMTWVL